MRLFQTIFVEKGNRMKEKKKELLTCKDCTHCFKDEAGNYYCNEEINGVRGLRITPLTLWIIDCKKFKWKED
ncbi:MAG: hypothetical protein ACXQS8_06560 [Candidatus Helarchaeales archaeon]